MQTEYPMPWANTGLAAPNNFTNSAGVLQLHQRHSYNHIERKICSHFRCLRRNQPKLNNRRYLMGGTNNQHDCAVPAGSSAGNTAAIEIRIL